MLSGRKMQILRAIVESYIDNGEPVGSKYLIAREGLNCSSATVRSEMSELEDMGFLVQPHTSSGRIPTERGYRYYVDSLMQTYAMTSEELRELNNLVKSKAAELDGILERAASLMSSLTNYTALTVRKGHTESSVISYKTVMLTADMFLLIMVTENENVRTKHIRIEQGVDEEGLERLEHSLNSLLRGVNPENITLPVMMQLQSRMYGYEYLIPPVLKAIYELQNEKKGADIHVEGMNRLLAYPEMQDYDKLSGLLGVFDRKRDLLDVIAKSSPDSVNVYIGNENDMDVMKNSTFVFRTITSNDKVLGAIGIIGPCRMDYSKVVATVNYLSDNISNLFTLPVGDKEDKKQDGD